MPPPSPTIPSPSRNGPILVECKALRQVVSSATEAETGGLFSNGQNILPIRVALQELGHPQPTTPLVTDNATAETITRKAMRMKRSKSWVCVITGRVIRPERNNSAFTGEKEVQTTPTTSQSIILQRITASSDNAIPNAVIFFGNVWIF